MKKKRILIIIFCVLAVIMVASGIWAYNSAQRCRTELTVCNYSLEVDLTQNIRIVQLSDLHGWEFGENNADLIALVAQQEPDLILMTGDMRDCSDENADVVCELIAALVDVAPIYYCYGNHEYQWMRTNSTSLTSVLTEAGATVLDTEYLDVEINGQQLRIGGYHGYWKQPGMYEVTAEQWQQEFDFTLEFEDTDRYKILLNHIPTTWLDWGYIDDFPVDLVLTGHYHGGQIRLPLIGGVYAPYVGLFPKYTEGMFTGEEATCILSAGLGASPGIPRINNLPQVVVVDLVRK